LKLGLLTALFDYCARVRKLDKDDVAEALLSIVRDGHRSDTGLIVILDHLVIFCVSFRWENRGVKPRLVYSSGAEHSLTMVRLRVSKEEGKARWGYARWTRSAPVRFDAYRRECILVKLAGQDTSHDTDKVGPSPFEARRGHAVTYLRLYGNLTLTDMH
jgi:hypothetical protein